MAHRRPPGALEAAVMRVLWSAGTSMTAGEVRDSLTAESNERPAFTTVVTVLNRLHLKGRVVRAVNERGTLGFSTTQSESAHAAEGMLAALLATSDRGAALLQFTGSLDAHDMTVLRAALEADDDSGTAG